jgi:hypothetical protein
MQLKKIVILVCFLAGNCLASKGNLILPKDTSTFLKRLTKKRDFLLAPQLDRSPETGFLTGIYYLQLFKIRKERKDTTNRTSNTETTLSYTEKNQFIAELNNTLLFHKEKYILRGTSVFKKFNEYFYGIGNGIDLKQRELIDFNLIQLTQRFTRTLKNHCHIGVQGQFYQTRNIHYIQNGFLQSSGAIGINGSYTTGFGPLFLYDSRDNVVNSRKGLYLDVSALYNTSSVGSQYSYQNFTLDARKFIKVYGTVTLCLQGLINFNWGQIPFRQLAQMGGDIIMRGYYTGAFRDNNMVCVQAEMRIPLYKFFGIVLFSAFGEVAHNINQFNLSNAVPSSGIGLRFMFIRHERINVGGDLGFGRGVQGLYLGSGEAF